MFDFGTMSLIVIIILGLVLVLLITREKHRKTKLIKIFELVLEILSVQCLQNICCYVSSYTLDLAEVFFGSVGKSPNAAEMLKQSLGKD